MVFILENAQRRHSFCSASFYMTCGKTLLDDACKRFIVLMGKKSKIYLYNVSIGNI